MAKNMTVDDVRKVYDRPLLELIFDAATIHRRTNQADEVQLSTLVSIKTGACPEDCAYCPQAARYQTDVTVHKLMSLEEVLERARRAKEVGSSRLCMGASWREVKDGKDFDRVIEMVSAVNKMGLEVCCTLGMVTADQADRLADAGLYAYNHNLDTSEEFYDQIITTRQYEDRLQTLQNVRDAGMTVCSGGILGMGESEEDRMGLLATLANLSPVPESVPINALVPVPGTPLENETTVSAWDMIRMVATTRVVMPTTAVRLSAGRTELSAAEQALCFLAGANSIFVGDQLLTTPNPNIAEDVELLNLLGLTTKRPEPVETEVKLKS